MTGKWWLAIQNRYPNALQDCIDYFQSTYRDQWRIQIRRIEQLERYFGERCIEIEIRRGYVNISFSERGYRYGSGVKGERLGFQRAFVFHTREKALQDALYFAFLVREEELEASGGKFLKWRTG